MTMALMGRPMAEEKAKPFSVKLHPDVIQSARIVAAYKEVSMQDLLSDILRPILSKMEADEFAKRSREGKKPKQ